MSIGLWITLGLVAAILFFSARFMKNWGVVKHGYKERIITAWAKARAARRNPSPVVPSDKTKPTASASVAEGEKRPRLIRFPSWRKSPRRRNKK